MRWGRGEILPPALGPLDVIWECAWEYEGGGVVLGKKNPRKREGSHGRFLPTFQEFDYASATSIALVMLAAAFVILFINAWLQSRASKIVSGIA